MRVLGIDFGARRVGLAVSDTSGILARPWKTLTHVDDSDERIVEEMTHEVGALVADADGLSSIVVGLPLRLDGSPNEQTDRVRTFAEALARATRLPVALQDERLTSREAESLLAMRERDWRRRKAKLDAASAAIILQEYLDARGSRGPYDPYD